MQINTCKVDALKLKSKAIELGPCTNKSPYLRKAIAKGFTKHKPLHRLQPLDSDHMESSDDATQGVPSKSQGKVWHVRSPKIIKRNVARFSLENNMLLE